MSRNRTLLLALLLDASFGDPPNRFHPVAWMGAMISLARRLTSIGFIRHNGNGNRFSELVYGGCIALGGSLFIAAIGEVLERGLKRLPALLSILGEAVLLKSTVSLRGLSNAADEVHSAMEAQDIPTARRILSLHLVSRDTSSLDESQVSAATIESVAENLSDGILAPLSYYLLGGLPLALAYRFINTADSMLGYHTPELEWVGKVSARLDDLLNYFPSRITSACIILSAPFIPVVDGSRRTLRQALSTVQRDARNTQSPNAGYPMSAMAGVLGVELEKVGHYRLGCGGRKPNPVDIQRARHIILFSTCIAVVAFNLPRLKSLLFPKGNH